MQNQQNAMHGFEVDSGNTSSASSASSMTNKSSPVTHRRRGKNWNMSETEKKILSRERNRVHAQRTRQRKKEQMQNLQSRANELKEEQMRLQRIINEKTTASILVHMFAEGCVPSSDTTDSGTNDVEKILQRSPEEIPDPSKIPELPSLILPGQHASKTLKAQAVVAVVQHNETSKPVVPPDGETESGIDFALLGRDRSQCTSEELDAIRRERNRMHAKRTRDRKRFFTERLAELCRQLEDENLVLNKHLRTLDPKHTFKEHATTSTVVSPPRKKKQRRDNDTVTFDLHISTLLRAAASQSSESSSAAHEVSSDDSGSASGSASS